MTRLSYSFSCMFAVALSAALLAGCDPEATSDPLEVTGLPPATTGDHDHNHGHAEHQGPHDGHVIELGRNHEFHAELVEKDDDRSVSIYILDNELQELKIAEESISLSLTAEGETQNFELSPVEAVEGKTSQFTSTDENLFATLHDHEEVDGKVRVTIEGKPYTGELHHHAHDHHAHDHHGRDHHDGEGHDHKHE